MQNSFKEKPKHVNTNDKNSKNKFTKGKKENDSLNNDNTFYKRTVSKEIQDFFNEKPIFPCLLISKDDNGNIETNMSCLNDIDIEKIKAVKEDSFEIVKRKDIINTQMIDFSNYQFDISVIHNNANFSKNAKFTHKKHNNDSTILGKYKLYSFNITEGDLSFKKHIIDRFKNIANDNSSDTIKAKEIDEIFESQGYYIPLKIYIGGLFINNYNLETIKGLGDSFIHLDKEMKHEEKLEITAFLTPLS